MSTPISQKPESICVRFDVPADAVFSSSDTHSENGRKGVELMVGATLANEGVTVVIDDGAGTLQGGQFYILTDTPAAALRVLRNAIADLPCKFSGNDLLQYTRIGLWDKEDKIWRTFYPRDTRPFFTALMPPEKITALIQLGQARRAQAKPKLLLDSND